MNKQQCPIQSYIDKAEPFARPILTHLRKLAHLACPEIEEGIKWGCPHFSYKGIVCTMTSFQKHCTFGFWKGALMKDPHHLLKNTESHSMGRFEQLRSLADLPSDEIIIAYIQEAVHLNKLGKKVEKVREKEVVSPPLPDDFAAALEENSLALETFHKFPPGKQNEYIAWIVEAKRDSTRAKRLTTAIQWLTEGKGLHWKYESISKSQT